MAWYEAREAERTVASFGANHGAWLIGHNQALHPGNQARFAAGRWNDCLDI